MVCLQTSALVAMITAGDGPTALNTASFGRHKNGCKRPQGSLKISSGVTLTAVCPFAEF